MYSRRNRPRCSMEIARAGPPAARSAACANSHGLRTTPRPRAPRPRRCAALRSTNSAGLEDVAVAEDRDGYRRGDTGDDLPIGQTRIRLRGGPSVHGDGGRPGPGDSPRQLRRVGRAGRPSRRASSPSPARVLPSPSPRRSARPARARASGRSRLVIGDLGHRTPMLTSTMSAPRASRTRAASAMWSGSPRIPGWKSGVLPRGNRRTRGSDRRRGRSLRS